MDANDPRRRETEALIQAIWGPAAVDDEAPVMTPERRRAQNAALADAMKAYLQQYLTEL